MCVPRGDPGRLCGAGSSVRWRPATLHGFLSFLRIPAKLLLGLTTLLPRDTIRPLVAPAHNEEVECITALMAFIKTVQSAVLRALNASLTALVKQTEAVLGRQRKDDFLPPETAAVPEAPTMAATTVKALLVAAAREVNGALAGPNLQSFRDEMAERAYSLVVAHLCRFTFSQTGALQLKHDVGEYLKALRAIGSSAAAEAADTELNAMVSILIISPGSLLGVVDGSLRMDRREALRFVQLREDFRSARVGNKSLSTIFSSAD